MSIIRAEFMPLIAAVAAAAVLIQVEPGHLATDAGDEVRITGISTHNGRLKLTQVGGGRDSFGRPLKAEVTLDFADIRDFQLADYAEDGAWIRLLTRQGAFEMTFPGAALAAIDQPALLAA